MSSTTELLQEVVSLLKPPPLPSQPNYFEVVANTDRSVKQDTRDLKGAALTSVTAVISSGSPSQETYVRVFLEDKDDRIIRKLCEGYVDTNGQITGSGHLSLGDYYHLRVKTYSSVAATVKTYYTDSRIRTARQDTWTGTFQGPLEGPGALKKYTSADPAAGSEISQAVPTNARWLPKFFSAQLVTAVAAADRSVRILGQLAAGGTVWTTLVGPAQAASLSKSYYGLPDYGLLETAFDAFGEIRLAGPWIEFKAGDVLVTNTNNLQAADNWSAATTYVIEHLDV